MQRLLRWWRRRATVQRNLTFKSHARQNPLTTFGLLLLSKSSPGQVSDAETKSMTWKEVYKKSLTCIKTLMNVVGFLNAIQVNFFFAFFLCDTRVYRAREERSTCYRRADGHKKEWIIKCISSCQITVWCYRLGGEGHLQIGLWYTSYHSENGLSTGRCLVVVGSWREFLAITCHPRPIKWVKPQRQSSCPRWMTIREYRRHRCNIVAAQWTGGVPP